MNSKNLKVIDMRLRPPFKSLKFDSVYLDYANDLFAGTSMVLEDDAAAKKLESEAIKQRSMEFMIQEMNEAGVEIGVVPIRRTKDNISKNDDLIDLLNTYPGRFIGVAGIDPWDGDAALAEIDKYVVEGPCKAVGMEPGQHFIKQSMPPDAELLFPIYEKCQSENIICSLTFGGQACADLHCYNPEHLDVVARTFPSLKLIINHGGWPYPEATCLLAMQNENIYLSPDHYMHKYGPGHEVYIAAANGFLRHKIIYGTTYPLGPRLIYHIENFFQAGIREDVLPDIMYYNAARLFGIEDGLISSIENTK